MDKLALITVPYAGGSSAAFIKMFSAVKYADVIHYDYPGHGERADEPFLDTIQQLAEDLADLIMGKNIGRYCLFGHSMGAMVSYYAEMLLEKNYGISAERLILSACLPPSGFYGNRLSMQTPEEIRDYLINKRKIPEDILKLRTFRNNIYYPFENDVYVINRYEIGDIFPVKAPVTCIFGSSDEDIDEAGIKHWKEHTASDFGYFVLTGDHFYFENSERQVLEIIEDVLH